MAGEPHPNPSPKGEGRALEVSHLNSFAKGERKGTERIRRNSCNSWPSPQKIVPLTFSFHNLAFNGCTNIYKHQFIGEYDRW